MTGGGGSPAAARTSRLRANCQMSAPMIPVSARTRTHVTFSEPTARYWWSGMRQTSTNRTIQKTKAAIHTPKNRRKTSANPAPAAFAVTGSSRYWICPDTLACMPAPSERVTARRVFSTPLPAAHLGRPSCGRGQVLRPPKHSLPDGARLTGGIGPSMPSDADHLGVAGKDCHGRALQAERRPCR